MSNVRIAVAGAGMIGLRHIEEAQRSPAVELSAIVDPGPKAPDVATKEGVPLYRSLGELFAKDKPDGVVLATPNHMHVEQGLECIAAGVPCLATDTLAHRVMLRHGETGLICAGDLDFVEKLILLLRDASERERIGQAARAEAGRLFTQRHFETAVLRAYGFECVTLLPRKSVNAA